MVAPKSEVKLGFAHSLSLPIEPSNLALVIALSVALVLLLALLVPAGQVLPIFSLGAVAAAIGGGVLALAVRARAARDSGTWHVAGMFMLLGCIAGMLSGPDQVLQLFGVAPLSR